MCGEVNSAKFESGEQPPVKYPELVVWLQKHLYYDYSQEELLDAWGNQLVVVVSQAGTFAGLGSCGPDGKWGEGAGDDIILTFEEMFGTAERTKRVLFDVCKCVQATISASKEHPPVEEDELVLCDS